MAEIVLHHYPRSLYAEKVRRVLAYKRIRWRSVEQPMMSPKPELAPLTGGYRRVPVMQIGADVYCDSACILRRLEALHPEPACLPPAEAEIVGLAEDWADRRLVSLVMPPTVLALLPVLPPDILVDRAAMSPMLSKEAFATLAPAALRQAPFAFDRLERLLRDRPFILGDAFSLADAACFHPLWFARSCPELAAAIDARPALGRWMARIEGFGPGNVRPMACSEALAIARESEPADVAGGATVVAGLSVGDDVMITADDYGREGTAGNVVRLAADEITIRRRDPELGDLAVHFPRAGYRIQRQ
ncbi:MAG TPA: glutathione S-transferase family protein [Candidatus Eisenbacteria bacterium]|nr:glutathione S-transferase family protein [Candidatus Eisenbacteria bacterium]